LPRETQQYLSVREQERDREVRRSQNEAAQARKALAAERDAAIQAEQQRRQQKAGQARKWKEYAKRQDALFIERVPAFADANSRAALRQAARDYLAEIGFSREELKAFYCDSLLRDARIQAVILDGARYRQAQKAATAAAQSPAAPTESRVASQPRLDPGLVELQSLKRRLE
jgi:hypothetical protein